MPSRTHLDHFEDALEDLVQGDSVQEEKVEEPSEDPKPEESEPAKKDKE